MRKSFAVALLLVSSFAIGTATWWYAQRPINQRSIEVREARTAAAKATAAPPVEPAAIKPTWDWPVHDYDWSVKADPGKATSDEESSATGFQIDGRSWHEAIAEEGARGALDQWPEDDAASATLRAAVIRAEHVLREQPGLAWQQAVLQLADLPGEELRRLVGPMPESVRYRPRFRIQNSSSRLVRQLADVGALHSLAVFREGSLLASGVGNRFLFFDLDRGTLESQQVVKQRSIKFVAKSADERWLAGGNQHGPVVLWDLESGEATDLKELVSDESAAKGLTDGAPLQFSSDSKRLLYLHYEQRGPQQTRQPIVFDFDRRTAKKLTLPGCDVNHAAFLPDGKHIVVSFLDVSRRPASPHLATVNVETGAVTTKRDVVSPATMAFAVAHGQPLIATAGQGDSLIRLWNGAALEPLDPLATEMQSILSVAFAPDGRSVAAIDAEGEVWQIHLQTDVSKTNASQNTASQRLGTHGKPGLAICFGRDETSVISSSANGTVKVWRAASKADALEEPSHESVSGRVTSNSRIALSADGSKLAMSAANGDVQVWDAVTGEGVVRLRNPTGRSSRFDALQFSEDASLLAAAHQGPQLTLWRLKDASTPLQLVLPEHTRPRQRENVDRFNRRVVNQIRFSRDSKRLATCSNHYLRCFDLQTNDEIAWYDNKWLTPVSGLGRISAFSAMDFSADGSLLAATDSDEVLIRHADTGQLLRRLKLPTSGGHSVNVSLASDGSLVSASFSGRSCVWDVQTSELIWESRQYSPSVLAPGVTDKLIVGSKLGVVRSIDLSSGAEKVLLSVGEPVSDLSVTSGGSIAVRGDSGRFQIFDPTDLERELQRAWARTDEPSIFNVAAGEVIPQGQDFAEWREQFVTDIRIIEPPPQQTTRLPDPPKSIDRIRYPTERDRLDAWVYRPPDAGEPLPALVFFHSGFAFGPEDMLQCLEVTGDRFVVMTPMLRGENGGAGSFELWGGEVKDARAAIRWLAEREDVDPDQIYAFGHSVGGGVSALLSLVDNVPVRHTGSCGGLYPPSIFDEWADQLPFNDCPAERMTRLLIGNESHMLRDHFAYLGRQDPLEATSSLATEAPTNGSRLRIERVDGDHFTSFAPALRAYLGEIQKPK